MVAARRRCAGACRGFSVLPDRAARTDRAYGMSEIYAIDVRHLSKKYCPNLRRSLAYAVRDTLARLLPWLRPYPSLRKGEFWTLDDVSLQVRRGEGLAIIGHNGAGKSTLLKIIYGLLEPDHGSARTSGKVVGLLDLGAGIDPLLTGAENIVVVAMLHGLGRKAARNLIPSVLDFSQLQEAADTIVQVYSAGMKARLSYAIAVMLRPEILLIDEVLAVGDLAFQRKCISHLEQFMAGGGTLLLVSHVPHHVQKACSRAVLLDQGKVVASGHVGDVVRQYLERRPLDIRAADQIAAAPFRVLRLSLNHARGGAARCGEPAEVVMELEADEDLSAFCGFSIHSQDGWTCISSSFDREARILSPGRSTLRCEIASLPLVAGTFLLRPILADSVALQVLPLGGPDGGGSRFDVVGEADLFSNGEKQLGQLVHMDACWMDPDANGSVRQPVASGEAVLP
ncbi:polysaccharide ABC transporter ATP-binding protein [Novosphingobium sp. ST904]|uniref:ABC transporter ATP-binding protein n=1 Tax=Novosphingobium sp. ST904 TaxID=1684385 RepID=UPI0012E20C1F|nr:polysaccharide ABC transporter ATP-binding protein [Novosphingobium sp. ST904]